MTSTTKSEARTVRTADLTAAQRKVLVALFGEVPDAKSLALVGRKGSAKTQPECECGCGTVCPSPFVIGHDASLKSAINAIIKGLEPEFNGGRGTAVRGFSAAKATAELAKRNW